MSQKNPALKATTNVEILPKLECQKSLLEQLEVMEKYTQEHERNAVLSKEKREIEGLNILFPRMLRKIEPNDLIAGRYDALPIGFGCVTSLGGVGHYCVFSKLNDFKKKLPEDLHYRVDKLAHYWEDKDTKAQFIEGYMDGIVMNAFSNESYSCPICGGVRLSGMMLDYNKLLSLGVPGLRNELSRKLAQDPKNEFYISGIAALELLVKCCNHYIDEIETLVPEVDNKRKKELLLMKASLLNIQSNAPNTFQEAMQLFWLYALLAGVINYGRLDDFLGEFLVNDLENGTLTYPEAKAIVSNLWVLIENKRTTVNGRIIVGGRGRKNPEAADAFVRLALEVCNEHMFVEPQFTLRLYKDTPKDIYNKALRCLADGHTYPTLYNDEVHVPGLQHCMRISEAEAEQYAPFGCGEINIVGKTVGTPNSIINLTKTLNIALNEGVDPFDGMYKAGPVKLKRLEEIESYEDFFENQYGKLHDYYVERCVDAQVRSYEILSENVSFIFNSLLVDNCIEKGKAILDGGIEYLGGCCETYGNINCSDSMFAIKELVFEKQKYTLREINNALLANFEGYEDMRRDMLKCNKYGNDLEDVDKVAVDIYDRVANKVRDVGIQRGLHYYGIVIINNEANTKWGLKTSASADGRKNLVYLNPSNNPQGGADVNGPTAMLNSLVKFDPSVQVGTVQNIKFQRTFFKNNLEVIGEMFKGYFDNGGCQLMVTSVDHGELEDAMIHPEKYPNLIVRVSGFSARFVDLKRTTQEELLSRTLYDTAY